jgi:hypothetical protein
MGDPLGALPPCLSIHQSLHPRFGLGAGFEIEHSRRDTVDREIDLYREAGFLTGPYDAYACHATIVSRGGIRRERHSGARRIGPGDFVRGVGALGVGSWTFFPPSVCGLLLSNPLLSVGPVGKIRKRLNLPPRP